MTSMLDLGPPARQVITLLEGVRDEQLSAPTPCTDYTVGDLLDHVMGLTAEFRQAADKTPRDEGTDGDTGVDGAARTDEAGTTGPGRPSAATLHARWRSLLPDQLRNLASAWEDPTAWEGQTVAGGLAMPAEVAGLVALDELVLHGWDLARATGQPYEVDPGSAQAVLQFTTQAAQPQESAGREGLFGPVVEVGEDAPVFDRALGLSGRDPAWTQTDQ